MPELIRGRWYKKYINCYEDKRDYDYLRRGFSSNYNYAIDYCKRYNVPDLSAEDKKT